MTSVSSSDVDSQGAPPSRRIPAWEAFLIRLLTGLVIAFFGSIFGGIAWLVFQSTSDPAAPKNRITIATVLALVAVYLVFLGLKKIVRREPSQKPELSEAEQVRRFNTVAVVIMIMITAIGYPFTSGLAGPLFSGVIYGLTLYFGALAVITAHELGHCLAAWAFGQRVGGFCVGDGREIWSKNLRGVHVTWRLLPIAGHVAVEEDQNWSRVGIISFAAAGPVVTLLFGAVILILSPEQLSGLASEAWLQVWGNVRQVMLEMVVGSSVLSLLPLNVPFGDSYMPSDGRIIMSALLPSRGE